MGKTVTRAVAGAATMGLSEVVRAGVNTVKAATSGGDVLGALADAGTFGAAGAVKDAAGLSKKAGAVSAAAVDQMPNLDDIKQKVVELTSDVTNPLDTMRRRARTLLTGGLGVPGDDSVVRKTLLGV